MTFSSSVPRNHKRSHTHIRCLHCGALFPANAPGTRHRNHCPHCLWSQHLDLSPGDRKSPCQGVMEPIAIAPRPDGEWRLVHRCTRCGTLSINRIAGDDGELALLAIALRPIAHPPFPLYPPG